MKSKLIIAGGFLGAGKTSLLYETAKRITKSGGAVGLITNDQAAGLVDTALLESGGGAVREVSGSCFCCNFGGFADAVEHIRAATNGGVIIAEPVGSCTDLSATIMQPLKERYSDTVDLAPLTVLADPYKLRGILDGADSPAAYIVKKQFEEADIILINKSDLLTAGELAELQNRASVRFNNPNVMTASVKTGAGLGEWLDAVLSGSAAGGKIAEVDYDIYAKGEAAFGWLNATFSLEKEIDYERAASGLIARLDRRFAEMGANVGHVKFLLRAGDMQIIANITGGGAPAIRLFEGAGGGAELIINARVEMAPDALEAVTLEEVGRALSGSGYRQTALKCLIPGRPNPTYRYSSVV